LGLISAQLRTATIDRYPRLGGFDEARAPRMTIFSANGFLSPQTQPCQSKRSVPGIPWSCGISLQQDLRDAFVRSLETMFRFYGFKSMVQAMSQRWNRGTLRSTSRQLDDSGNDNHLRITRILACMRAIGFSRMLWPFFGRCRRCTGARAQRGAVPFPRNRFHFGRARRDWARRTVELTWRGAIGQARTLWATG